MRSLPGDSAEQALGDEQLRRSRRHRRRRARSRCRSRSGNRSRSGPPSGALQSEAAGDCPAARRRYCSEQARIRRLAGVARPAQAPGGVQQARGPDRRRGRLRSGLGGPVARRPRPRPPAPPRRGRRRPRARRASAAGRAPPEPARAGASSSRSSTARTASIPTRACSRSRSSSLAIRRADEVEDADDALEQQVLDADLAQLLLEPLPELLLGRAGLGCCSVGRI